MGIKSAAFFLVVFCCSLLAFEGEAESLGPLTREAILEGHPDWQEKVASYQPDPLAVEKLKTVIFSVQVEVFLGTWCPDSKAHVSEFFKVLDLVDNPLLSALYIGIPRDRTKRAEYYQGRDIQKLPTFIVNVDGKEKGRIVEVPLRSVEQDLWDILSR